MKKLLQIREQERGSILLVVIITLPFLVLLAIYYTNLSVTSFKVSRLDQLHSESQLAADAGADYAVEELSTNNSWTGTTGAQPLQNDGVIKTTFTASVTGNSSSKTIAVTGYTYWPASSTTPSSSVSVYVNLYPVTTGNYSLVTGAGGLVMSNSSKVVGGNVLINGSITMSNTAQIGLSTNPVNVEVADQTCPNPPTSAYPEVCAAGVNGQPISINNNAEIYGSVTATNQTNGSGMSDPGLVSGGTAAPQPLPTYNRAAQVAAVANTMTGSAASCSGKSNITWPANTEITGNVTLSNSCTVTVDGNVWITGTFNMSNTTEMIVASSVGTTMPVIMIDGSGGAVFSNSSDVVSNSNNTGIEFITFYSTASCSPSCTSVTGTSLASSRTDTTISLSNSAVAPNSIFYAYWTQVNLANSGQIGAVIGQTVDLSNTAAITFGSTDSGVGNTTWIIKGYRRQ